MIKLVLLVAAIAIFGTGFITVIINQFTSAKILLWIFIILIIGWFDYLAEWQFCLVIR
ncbi:Spiroplasmavirus-related protein [Spiroplasma kunkelii CR2-3x]|uniref:Spiroplasmavirus-related protein n=1 Tax=Spiroplasma kunkelii CR2-3x TaxID=273035 RepID=A0A0K2JHM9_SPIKU|nr:hypothetical protein [Spiroplasma kunkelii]ALA97736.1 Spiroplasmavirus-related protein [Spiroplasma kunkelii CR2-3x]